MKTSYSQSSTYKDCSQHWKFRYVDKLEGDDSGASTYFGTAVDSAVMWLLEGKTGSTFKEVFSSMWLQQKDRKKNDVILWDNENIIFGHADFDKDVLDPTDLAALTNHITELKLEYLGTDPVEIYKAVAKIKKNPFKKLKTNELKYFNRASWLSMHRKGLILLDSFFEQFFPKIEKVLATQKFSLIKDDTTGDIIQGVVDMVLKLRGIEKPIIFDLKTAARPYTQEQIDHSDQLTLYAAMEGWKYGTDHVGYVVLSKNINKEKVSTCNKCGYTKDGRHKTCNNMVAGPTVLLSNPPQPVMIRCEGEWTEKTVIKPIVQVLIEKKSVHQVEQILDDQANIIVAMKNNVVFKNTSKCLNWYGNKCPFYNLCHNGDMTGLTKKG